MIEGFKLNIQTEKVSNFPPVLCLAIVEPGVQICEVYKVYISFITTLQTFTALQMERRKLKWRIWFVILHSEFLAFSSVLHLPGDRVGGGRVDGNLIKTFEASLYFCGNIFRLV